MLIDMPFQHKYRGRHGRGEAIAVRVCWDKAIVDVPEVPAQEFEPGCDLGDGISTWWRDGAHWAYYGTSVTGKLDYRSLGDSGKRTAMLYLAENIDQRTFHDDCRVQANPRVLHSQPSEKQMESSERDRNVARLQDWVTANVAIVGPDLLVRVNEPSIRLYMTHPNTAGVCGMRIQTTPLTPVGGLLPPGLHVSVNNRYELYMFAQQILRRHREVDDLLDVVGSDRLREMKLFRDSGENMHEMTLRSLAYVAHIELQGHLKLKRTGGNSRLAYEEAARLLNEIGLPTEENVSDAYMCKVMEALKLSRPYLTTQTRIAADFALERWDDRPVLDLGLPRTADPVLKLG